MTSARCFVRQPAAQADASPAQGVDTINAANTRPRRTAVAALACVVSVVLSSCGTRVSDTEIAQPFPNSVSASTGESATATTSDDTASAPAPATAPLAPGSNVAVSSTAPPAGGASPQASAQKDPGVVARPAAAPDKTTPQTGTSRQACTRQGPPIVIGQTGAFSGLVGQSTGNLKTGLTVWARYINSIGGIQCHPVQLFQMDDGSDPSKASANINDLVRNKHAIAIVAADIPIVVAAARSTAAQLGVPIVGGDMVATDWVEDPNMFPSGGSPLATYGGAIVQAVADTGKKKVGVLYCVEASICGYGAKNFEKMVAPSGGQVVFKQSASLTQSSFTPECQNAKSAGVEILFLFVEGSAAQRVASSCKNLGYHPVLATAGIAASPNATNDPNIKEDTIYIGNNEVPFLEKSLPALQVFHQAFEQFYGGPAPDQPSLKGWNSGQLFAAAIDALGATVRDRPVVTADVYDGLYKLHDETLGGLLPKMNYIKGKPSPLVNCYTTIKNSTVGLTAPRGVKFICN